MTTLHEYNSLQSWNDPQVHIIDIDIGPNGDVYKGQVALKGDRWKHERIGFAEAVACKVTKDVTDVALEALSDDSGTINVGSENIVYVLNTENFIAGDNVYISDNTGNDGELAVIFSVQDNVTITLTADLSTTYTTANNAKISRLVDIYVEKGNVFVAGEWVEIGGTIYQVHDYEAANDNHPDDDLLLLRDLDKTLSPEDVIATLNTASWTRNENNPIIGLQRNNFYDYSGQNVGSPEIFQSFDVQKDSTETKVLTTKHAVFLTSDIENESSQISVYLSKDENDILNWSSFLGANNSGRPNPIIRSSFNTEGFDYNCYNDDINEVLKVWNTEDGTIALDLVVETPETEAYLQVDYTDDGEVWGLMPVPINGDIATNNTSTFSFYYKGTVGNTGTLYVKIIAANGTSLTIDPSVDIDVGTFTHYTADLSSFDGRKYITAIVFGISGNGSGTFYVKDISPFMPPRWDEIIKDPTVVKDAAGVGNFVCYYTARARPRQILTTDALISGLSSLQVGVSDTSDFSVNDTVVLYDRSNYEMALVTSIDTATAMTIRHIGYDEDSSVFENNYQTTSQAMIANNTYRTNKIGASYLIPSIVKELTQKYDNSQWIKYTSNELPTPVLSPSVTPGDWDSTSVSQPCVRTIGGRVEMAYVGSYVAGDEQIGFAHSMDYASFVKNPDNPLIAQGSNFDRDGCLHPDLSIFGNKAILNYTGLNAGVKSIGSALYQTKFHISCSKMHIAMLVFPLSSEGNIPEREVRTLIDLGNFRIDVHSDNTLSAHACVKGKWIDTKADDNVDISNSMGTKLMHDHWNLIVGQYNCGEVSIHKTNMMIQNSDGYSVFNRSPWVLSEDASPGATSVVLKKFVAPDDGHELAFIPAPIEDQDIGFYGRDTAGNRINVQMNRITTVTYNGDTPSTYTCDLLNPIGTWGFSSDNLELTDETSYQPLKAGVYLSQGISAAVRASNPEFDIYKLIESGIPSDQARAGYDNTGNMSNWSDIRTKILTGGSKGGMSEEGYWKDYKTGKTLEAYKMDNANGYQDEVQYTWIRPKFDPRPLLDVNYSRPPVIGNNQELSKAWNFGYIGHVDIALNEIYEDPVSGVTNFTDIYNQAINNSNVNFRSTAKPQWHLFNLSGFPHLANLGGEIIPNNLLTRWLMTDWDGTKFIGTDANDDPTGLDLYLDGSAAQTDDGYLGSTMYMTEKVGDAASTLFFTDNFTKLNGTNAQFEKAADGWDGSDVSASNLFRFNDQYHLAYTGRGKIVYPRLGAVYGDLFETSILDDSFEFTFESDMEVPVGTTISLYMSLNKKPIWYKLWDAYGVGSTTLSQSFTKSDLETSAGIDIFDYKYFVRWGLLFESNPARDKSPIVKNFSVSHADVEQSPTAQFLEAQSKRGEDRKGVYKVRHWNKDTNEFTNITSKVKPNGISSLTFQIPVDPDRFGEIYAADVNIEVQNTDGFFSQNNDGSNPSYSASIFNNRNYLHDEIILYSGFETANALAAGLDGEYECSGRFKINRIPLGSKKGATIECRSIIRSALDTVVGKQVDGEDNPLVYNGKVKTIMEDLLINKANINTWNIFIEDVDREFGNIEINNRTVGDAIASLAQACEGVIFTDAQGNINFKKWQTIEDEIINPLLLIRNVNVKDCTVTGLDYDRLVKSVDVRGEGLIQSTMEDATLVSENIGRDIPINNSFIQRQEWADEMALNILLRFGMTASSAKIKGTYMPSISITNGVSLTDPSSFLENKKFITHNIIRNITTYEEDFDLISIFK